MPRDAEFGGSMVVQYFCGAAATHNWSTNSGHN